MALTTVTKMQGETLTLSLGFVRCGGRTLPEALDACALRLALRPGLCLSGGP